MILKRLRIDRLPGIDQAYEVAGLVPGVNVIHGPNASGKSSLGRAFRALAYREEPVAGPHQLEAELDVDGTLRQVTRATDVVRWSVLGGGDFSPPELPAYRHLACYTVSIDDLMTAGGTEAQMAERIARELAGGFDLAAVRQTPELRLKATHGTAEANRLRDARLALSATSNRQRDLRHEADRLARLEQDQERLTRAAAGNRGYQAALDALRERHRLRQCQATFAGFEPFIGRLRGDELERLARLRKEREELEHRRDDAVRTRAEAEAQAQRSGYLHPGDLPAGEELELARARLGLLQECEARLSELEGRQVQAQARCRAALTELGGPEEAQGAGQAITPQSVREAEVALAAKRAGEAALRSLDAELDDVGRHEERGPGPRTEAELDAYRQARSALLAWLAREPPASSQWLAPGGGALARWVALAGMLGGGGVCVLLGGWLYLGLLVAPLVAVIGWCRQDWREREPGEFARQRFTATGMAPPRWERAAVETALEACDGTIRAAAALFDQRRRRARLLGERRRREEALAAEVSALKAMAEQFGFDPGALDASFDRWLRLSRDLDTARRAAAEIAAAVGAADARRQGLLRQLQEFLGAAAGAGPPRVGELPGDASAVGQALQGIERRLRDGAQAHGRRQLAELELERCGTGLEENLAGWAEVFGDACVAEGDEVTLARGVNLLEAYRQAERALHDAQATERRAREQVPPDLELRAAINAEDEAGLRDRLADGERAEQSRLAVVREIATITERVNAARAGAAMETASAEERSALEALHESRDAAELAVLGNLLLDQVEEEHVEVARPAVVNEADRLFAAFTRFRYRLGLRSAGAGERPRAGARAAARPSGLEFAALDSATEREVALGHLSVGTRMQLLLALRLAFASALEREGERMPLFVDEALATANPERFRAVAASMTDISEVQGRQVIYLTARPDEAAQWKACGLAAHTIDLAALRGHSAPRTDWESAAVAERVPVPQPAGRTAATYANLLGVPAIDPWAAAGQVHVYHLLSDDLAALHGLLEVGVTSAGQLGTFLQSTAASRVLSTTMRATLQWRLKVLRAWLASWREGRGRPLTEPDLIDAPVTAAFIEKVTEQVGRVQGSARALLAALEAGEVPRFRVQARHDLEQWLREEGFLDDRAILDEAQRLQRVLAHLPEPSAEHDWTAGEVSRCVGWMESALEAGVAPVGSVAPQAPAAARA